MVAFYLTIHVQARSATAHINLSSERTSLIFQTIANGQLSVGIGTASQLWLRAVAGLHRACPSTSLDKSIPPHYSFLSLAANIVSSFKSNRNYSW